MKEENTNLKNENATLHSQLQNMKNAQVNQQLVAERTKLEYELQSLQEKIEAKRMEGERDQLRQTLTNL